MSLLNPDEVIDMNVILQTIPDPLAVYDQKGRCKYINFAFEQVFGWRLEELSDPLHQFVPKEQIESTLQIYQGLIRQKRPTKFENQRLTKAGRLIDVIISAAVMGTSNGKQPLIVVIYTDITEKKRLMEQLRQSQKMDALGTLAEGIALDINDILGIIVGNTELAIDDLSPTNPVQEYLDEIKTASLRARDVIEQIIGIDFMTEQTKIPLNMEWVVKKSLKILRPLIPQAIEIKTNFASDLKPISADPTQLNELIKNICVNAGEAMENAGGLLQVSVESVEFDQNSAAGYRFLPGKYVKIEFKDNGCGIDPAIKSRIFDPYFTTKIHKKGCGMGLAVVHGIIKSYGGAIDILSVVGEGTTVSVFFPVLEKKAIERWDSDLKLATGKERILFIDDEIAILKLARKIISRLGYQVETQKNPAKALEIIRKNPEQFDLAIVAGNMFRMNGTQFAKRLSTIAPIMPVIITAARSQIPSQQERKPNCTARYITKPVDKRQLAQVIRSALDGCR